MSPQLIVPDAGRHARISGVGGYRPDRVVTNEEICRYIDSSDEWIRQRSGIVERRIARPDETVVDMSEAASRDALAMAGISGDQVDVVLVATVTHLYQTPAAAPLLAVRLGATSAAAFDVSAACAGYCYAISLANDMVRAGSAEHVLVVGVEKLSDFTDRTDRGTAFIFGDGAGAAVVSASDVPAIGPTVWGSDGENWDKIQQRQSWKEVWDAVESDRDALAASGPEPGSDLSPDHPAWPHFAMQGQSVFRWAVYSMAPIARKAMDAAGVGPQDLDVFIPHQANMRITDAMIKELGLPAHVPVARDIASSGNTSAASVPLATTRMLESGEAKSGDLALQFGFGAGLVYAAQVVVLP